MQQHAQIGSEQHSADGGNALLRLVADATGASPAKCYQCGRCSAGCIQNVTGEMDISPTRMMHLLQLEHAFADEPERAASYAREALGADTCWLCAGCMACTTRCPQGVEIAGTMDVLRQESLKRGVASRSKRARDIQTLHRVFLDGAMKHGRIHELTLVMWYKLRSGHLFQDAMLGATMFAKGKLRILPEHRPDTSRVQRAVSRLDEQEGTTK